MKSGLSSPPVMLRATGIALAALAAASCAGGLQSGAAATQAYVLAPGAPPPRARIAEVRLQISAPALQPGLASDRIALVRPDRRFDYYAASRWTGPLSQVVEALAVETFRAGGALAGVQDDAAPFLPDYVLRLAVRHFEAVYATEGGAPLARVSFDCTLGRRADRGAVASFVADATAEATENRLASIVAAFERAAQSALAAAHEQTLAAIAADAVQNAETPLPSMSR